MKKKYGTLVKNLGLFMIGSFGAKLVSFFMIPLYTSILSTNDYGTVDILQSTAQLLIPLLLLSIQDATLRFSMDNNYRKEDVLLTTFNIIIKGSIMLLLGIIIVSGLKIINISNLYWCFLYLTFLFGALNNCCTIYLKAKDDAKIIAISGIVGTFITCLSNIVFLIVLKFNIIGYMISNLLGIGNQIIIQILFGKIYKDFHIKKYTNLSKEMTQYSKPLIINSISWWFNNASDRYILTWISGVAANGIYAVAYKIPNLLTMFQNIFYNAWSISAISEYDEKDKDGFIGNNYMIYSFLSITACSMLLLINIPLAKILYAGEYFIAWIFVPFLLLSTVFYGISQFEGSLFAATKKTKEVSRTTFWGAIINTFFNIVLIYQFGAIGAAIATALGYFAIWILRTKYIISFIEMKVEWKKHIISIICLIIQTILATLNILYFIQLILLIIIIILHYNYINKIISKLISKGLNYAKK